MDEGSVCVLVEVRVKFDGGTYLFRGTCSTRGRYFPVFVLAGVVRLELLTANVKEEKVTAPQNKRE